MGSESALLLTDAQRRELERRLAEYEASPYDVVHWDVVKDSTPPPSEK